MGVDLLPGDGDDAPKSLKDYSFAEIFEEQCPIYMSYGMTYEQFWDGDPKMAIAYRKAHELKKEIVNEQLWLQGAYIYDALQRIAPLFRVMSSDNPEPYLEKPYRLKPKTKQEIKAEQKKEMEDMQAYLEGFMAKQESDDKKGGK